jgi:hypothetical protein
MAVCGAKGQLKLTLEIAGNSFGRLCLEFDIGRSNQPFQPLPQHNSGKASPGQSATFGQVIHPVRV